MTYLDKRSLPSISPSNSDSEIIQRWLRQIARERRPLYWRLAAEFLAFTGKPLAEITLADVRTFVSRQGYVAVADPSERLVAIKSLLVFGYRNGLLPVNIAPHQWPKVPPKRPPKRSSTGKTFLQTFAFGSGLAACVGAWAAIAPLFQEPKQLATPPATLPGIPEVEAATLLPHESIRKNPNVKAFLDTIAWAEGTARPDGYRLLFTGAKFSSLADHPREIRCELSGTQRRCSSAAGRYQFLETTWDEVALELGLTDFSPFSQDLAAIELIKRNGALVDVELRRFESAIGKLAPIWASLPGNGYGQPQKSTKELKAVYQKNIHKYQRQNH